MLTSAKAQRQEFALHKSQQGLLAEYLIPESDGRGVRLGYESLFGAGGVSGKGARKKIGREGPKWGREGLFPA